MKGREEFEEAMKIVADGEENPDLFHWDPETVTKGLKMRTERKLVGPTVAFQKAVQAAGASSTNKGWLCLSPFQCLFLHLHNQPSVLSPTVSHKSGSSQGAHRHDG